MFSKIKDFLIKKRNKKQMERKGLIGVRKRKTQEDTLGNVAENSRTLFVGILVILWIICIIAIVYAPQNHKLESQLSTIGGRSPITVRADYKFSVVDFDAQERSIRNRLYLVPVYFLIDKSANEQIINSTNVLFDIYNTGISNEDLKELQSISTLQEDSVIKNAKNETKKIDKLSQSFVDSGQESVSGEKQQNNNFLNPAQLTTEQILFFKAIDKKFALKNYFIEQLQTFLANGVISRREKTEFNAGQKIQIIDTLNRFRQIVDIGDVIDNEILEDKLSENIVKKYDGFQAIDMKIIVKKFADYILKNHNNTNLILNEKLNAKEKEAIIKNIKTEFKNIKTMGKVYFRGGIIVKQNEILTENIIKTLKKYKQIEKKHNISNHYKSLVNNTSIALITLFLILVTGLYLWHIHPEIITSNQKLCLCGSVILMSIIFNYLAMYVFYILYNQFNIAPFLINQVMMIALPAVLLSVLIGLRVAFYVGLFCSIIASMMLKESYSLVLEGLLITALAGFAVRNSANYRTYFIRCILAVTFSLLLLNHSFLLTQFNSPMMLLWSFSLSLANGFITATLALVLMFILELVFGISSDMGLLTLCDYNHPLLKRLQMEAPGTFHHSLMVATLAEQAAVAVGASSIKVRVGALFHDIGKLHKPEYFTENNSENNKHSELRPRMSSLIIINHIKDGVDLAIKYKLRKFIRDTIERHHGTDLVLYFYNRAKEENNNINVDKSDYRYPGPLPKSKEIIIIMLADACEAASRSLQKPTHAKIESLVWELFRRRLRDGQLNNANITFRELSKIRDSFVLTLTTMLHNRIAYPKDEDVENENDLFVEQRKVPTTE